MYRGPVRISRFPTRLVLALPVSDRPTCFDLPPLRVVLTRLFILATSLNYEDDVTFCPDGSYCCGNNNTACCRSNSGSLEIFYGNPGPVPFATASLPAYYSSLKVSTKSRSTAISSTRSSTQTLTTASSSTVLTAGTSSMPAASRTIASHTPTSSTPATSPAPDSSNSTGNDGLSKSAKIAIGTVLPVAALVAGFVTWWLLGRRRLSSGEAAPKVARQSADVQLPDFHPPGELSSGLDRAELVTRQWDSAELPSGHLVELAARS